MAKGVRFVNTGAYGRPYAFGLFAVSAMLVCYSLERRHHGYILGFAFSCALGSTLRLPAGGLAIRLVEAIWALVAARRWWRER